MIPSCGVTGRGGAKLRSQFIENEIKARCCIDTSHLVAGANGVKKPET